MRRVAAILAGLIVLACPPAHAAPLLFHDHGFGLSFSSDGKALLMPSHDGLAAYEDGAWWQAPGPEQGFSGFSVAERAVYSSGHSRPGLSQGTPAGLVRSSDGGRTWQRLALGGEADFPLLAASYRAGVIYVLSNGRNSAMPAAGLYLTADEGKSWRPAAASGLAGEIHGLAAHPTDRSTLALATGKGLYLSRDAGETFKPLDRREPVTAVAFGLDGTGLRYAYALSNRILETTLEGKRSKTMRLPMLEHDYVTSLAQSPVRAGVLAFATRRGNVYVTEDGGVRWRRIAAEARADEPGEPSK